MREDCDVIVIGGGSAAFEAAVAVRQAGAERVVMVEKAPPEGSGGNALFSHTGFRFANSGAAEIRAFIPHVPDDVFATMQMPAYTSADLLADLMRVTQGKIDRTLATYMADESNRALHWMLETGIVWMPENPTIIDGKRYYEPGAYLHPKGGGPGQLAQWRRIAERHGIEVRYSSKVVGIHGDHRRVDGVRVATSEQTYDLMARSVIVCSGGFQANREMRARYMGANTDFVKIRGSRYNTGEVLRMLLDLGAQPAGHWQGAHMTPIDAEAPDVETPVTADGTNNSMNRYDFPLGIMVNSRGERFIDEGEASHNFTYAKTGRAVLAQPGGVAYEIFDAKLAPLLLFNNYGKATHWQADTIADLARRIGIAPAVLEHTVSEFNAAVRDDIPFVKGKKDGRCTEGLALNKSNWAQRIDTAPFQAYPVVCGITFTFGGVGITPNAQVLNIEGEPIRGLYASGDVVGLFFHNYPALTGQTRNVVFSLAAGRHAATAN